MRPTLSLRRTLARALDRLATTLPPALVPVPANDAGVRLSPLLHWLLHLRRLGAPADLGAPDVAVARRRFRRDLLPLRAGYPVRAVHALSVRGGAGDLRARHYEPERGGALPALLVYFHGGGYVLGDLDTHDDVCRLLCREAGLQVLSVDYRLAPEHPFPAAVDDAEAAVRWAQEHAARFGVHKGAIAVGGDSAGGNLAAVTAQRMAAVGRPLLAQLLIYPGTDRTVRRASHDRFGTGFFLSDADRDWFYAQYLAGDESLGADPRVSPLLAAPLPPLAPALVVTGGFDMLRDEGDAYAAHLRAHGTTTELRRFDQLGHGFMNLAAVHRDSAVAAVRVARDFRRLCNLRLAARQEPA